MSTPTLLTIRQVAACLGLSVGATYRRHQRGQLPGPIRLGRSLRWTESAIVDLIENKENTMSTIDTDTKPLPPRSPDSRVMNPAEMSALFAACGAVYAEPVPMSEEDRRKSEDPDFLGVLNGVDIYRK